MVGIGTRLWSKVMVAKDSLTLQFLLAATLMIFLVMTLLGTWITTQIERSVLMSFGTRATLFARYFIEPVVQDVDLSTEPSDARFNAVENLLVGTPFEQMVASVKIWRLDGLVLYATNKDAVGQIFQTDFIDQARKGLQVAHFADFDHPAHDFERKVGPSLIEVYTPLFRTGTDEVIAVAEIYAKADQLVSELNRVQRFTWLVVAASSSAMVGMLYLFVRRAAMMIREHRRQLEMRFEEAQRLSAQNQELKQDADRARVDASGQTEQFLSRVGSDIHDGPIQLLTLSALRMTTASRALTDVPSQAKHVKAQIEGAVDMTQEALKELRLISEGLNLPEVEQLDLSETLRHAVERHTAHTGEDIGFEMPNLLPGASSAVKICAFRIIQEGLNNATKHAPLARKVVRVSIEDGDLIIDVHDTGAGPRPHNQGSDGPIHLGLAGLKNRVTVLKGVINLQSSCGEGTHLVARLPIDQTTRL